MTKSQEFLVIGHRGARGHAPENTLLSFAKAIELGAHGVELDVQLHQGELLVFHDLTLDRTTNGKGRLADHSLADLRRFDAGQGQKIPTLREVLDLVDRRVRVNIEIKTAGGTAEAVAQTVKECVQRGWKPEQLLVSSFILPELRRFHAAAPEVPIGALLCGVPLDLAACASDLGATTLNLASEFVEPDLLADARRRGLKVYVYTVNDPAEIDHFRQLGIDGIFTDYPDRALRA